MKQFYMKIQCNATFATCFGNFTKFEVQKACHFNCITHKSLQRSALKITIQTTKKRHTLPAKNLVFSPSICILYTTGNLIFFITSYSIFYFFYFFYFIFSTPFQTKKFVFLNKHELAIYLLSFFEY